MRDRSRKRGIAAVAAALVATTAWLLPPSPKSVDAASGKITICHRTHSTTNPYRRITVSQSAVQNAKHGGHGLPTGSTNPAVYTASFAYAPNNKYWGDVIPGATNGGSAYNGTAQIAMNWTAEGQAIFFGATCGALSAAEFYDVEFAAGVAPADIIADLNEQEANEDAALLAALGGSFTLANLASWTTAVSVTTSAATVLTTTTAMLNGSLTVGPTSTVSGFQYGISPSLATSSTVTATPSPVTNTTVVSAAVSGLAPATTYYFRVIGTTNIGTDTEGILTGAILSFATPSIDTTTTTSTTVAPTTTSTTVEPTTTTSTVAPTTTSTVAPTPTTSTVAPTTSTVAPTTTAATVPTTTSQTASAPSSVGSVGGFAWFDDNSNGLFDLGEPALPGVKVSLGERTTTTAADGSYTFDAVAPGSYHVVAVASIQGFDYTFDTDGGFDWLVVVDVVGDTSAKADFAGLGRGEVAGSVQDPTTSQGLASALISCHWSGKDDVVGNDDDVTFTGVADPAGGFQIDGLPYGSFTCDAVDPVTAQQSSSVVLNVSSPSVVQVPLSVETAPSIPVAAPNGELPVTGGSSRGVTALAMLLITLGAVTTMLARRRRPSA